MLRNLAILFGKIVAVISELTEFGAGGTWPGELALTLDPNILQYFASRFTKGIILVVGTNGKTTTSLMIKSVLESDQQRIVHNDSGANLLNGIVSACIKRASWNGLFQADYGVFEVDENALPEVIKFIKFRKLKVIIVLLNLFRDQLDRYGEVDVIAEKWEKALRELNGQDGHGKLDKKDQKDSEEKVIQIVANADDPLMAHLGLQSKLPVKYFGINDKTKFRRTMEHAKDSTFCLSCGARLTYDGIYFSHIGIWKCPMCGEKRPTPNISTWKSPLPGLYNTYNTLAAVSVVKSLGYKDHAIYDALKSFTPAFGRQEEFTVKGRKVKIFLSKNPTGFNESLKTVLELGTKHIVLILNDRIPDGRDVSWIWDVDFEMIPKDIMVRVSGERVWDLALRLKYAGVKVEVVMDLKLAVVGAQYILPTYSAMLEVRKILTGKKIL